MIDAPTELWLRQIAEAPDDTIVRGVFADWLEDNGDQRAAAVRASVGAEECLLNFPVAEADWIAGAVSGSWSVSSPLYPTMRPLLRVNGTDCWRITNLCVQVTNGASLRVLLTSEMGDGWGQIHRWRISLGDLSGFHWPDWTAEFQSPNLLLCLSADRPTEAEVEFAMVRLT